ncbi:unnamed protein product [Mytilus edulis]|uniref:Uncharacterized protein n=1 Tax=Mytilus edulis TaxID=6550 RepID=A0A8S3VNM7_MYTED|nr:unnamed protein product [Mytilus edulis]
MTDYYGGGKLMEYKYDGKHIRDIPISNEPFSLTAIDTDRIAVTFGDKKYLEIINTTEPGIVVMDLNGKTLNTIDIYVFSVYNITATSDRIYYTDSHRNTVNCCSMTGQEIWVFNNKSISKPTGLSVDSNQNVFVVGQTSNKLTLIQHDGKDSKVLLSGCDGLESPYAGNYNKQTKIMCLGYQTGSVALYQVS